MKKTAMWLLAAASVWASAGLPVQAQVQEGTVQNEADAAPVLVQKKTGPGPGRQELLLLCKRPEGTPGMEEDPWSEILLWK
ncbi:MAG: hypothetical protein V8Q83_09680 [Blautia sp.]